jgi:hypothetical protein
MSGHELANGVAEQEIGLHAPAFQEPEEGHLQREESGLGEGRLVEQGGVLRVFGRKQDLAQRPIQRRRGPGLQRGLRLRALKMGADGIEGLSKGGEGRIEGAAHAWILASLSREEQGERAPGPGIIEHHVESGAALSQGAEGIEEGRAALGDHRGPPLEMRPRGGEGKGDVHEREVRVGLEVGAQPFRLRLQGRFGLGRHEHGQCRGQRRRRINLGGRLDRRGLLEDDMGVGAADAEGRDAGAAWTAAGLPGHGLGHEADGTWGPIDVRRKGIGVQALGQAPVLHGQDHLDDPGDACGGLRVAEVGLDGSEPERLILGTALTVGSEQGLCLDGVAQGGSGPVGLDDIDLARAEPGALEGQTDDALLGGAARSGESLAPAVLVDSGAADQGEYRMAVAPRIREAL